MQTVSGMHCRSAKLLGGRDSYCAAVHVVNVVQVPAQNCAPLVHAVPHPPQCSKVMRRSVSQPSAPSQSPKFALQTQELEAHDWFWPQARPQPPQLLTSMRVSTSQPLPNEPSQLA